MASSTLRKPRPPVQREKNWDLMAVPMAHMAGVVKVNQVVLHQHHLLSEESDHAKHESFKDRRRARLVCGFFGGGSELLFDGLEGQEEFLPATEAWICSQPFMGKVVSND